MYTILGIKDVNFKSKDGNLIEGKTFYVSRESPNVDGVETDKFFLSRAKYDDLAIPLRVGDRINPMYNRYGRIQSFEIE